VVDVEWKPSEPVIYNGVPIKGFIDKIEFEGNNCTLIDYKTGNAKYAADNLKPANPSKDFIGGDYWRQAVVYKILIDNYPKKEWVVKKAQFVYVEPIKPSGEIKLFDVNITPEDITIVAEQMKEVYHNIRNKNFYTGCSKPTCDWCNFVKQHGLAQSINKANVSNSSN
jgi:DNA helicase II / ATP-dependent DNA helicase PcrA